MYERRKKMYATFALPKWLGFWSPNFDSSNDVTVPDVRARMDHKKKTPKPSGCATMVALQRSLSEAQNQGDNAAAKEIKRVIVTHKARCGRCQSSVKGG